MLEDIISTGVECDHELGNERQFHQEVYISLHKIKCHYSKYRTSVSICGNEHGYKQNLKADA